MTDVMYSVSRYLMGIYLQTNAREGFQNQPIRSDHFSPITVEPAFQNEREFQNVREES